MRAFVSALTVALLLPAVGCGGRKKSLYGGVKAANREAIAARALSGKVFTAQAFTMVSGFASVQNVGGGTLRLFDHQATCGTTAPVGDGRMIEVSIPPGVTEYYYQTFEDSKEIKATIIFIQKERRVFTTSAELRLDVIGEDSVTGGMSAVDAVGDYVNGTFQLQRCTSTAPSNTSLDTSADTSSDTEAATATDTNTETATQTATSTATATSAALHH